MAAHTDQATTQQFADLLYRISEEDEVADLTVMDGAERGYMVPEGETLHIVDHDEDVEYLITVQKVVR